jgi:pilus assembly protein FimV
MQECLGWVRKYGYTSVHERLRATGRRARAERCPGVVHGKSKDGNMARRLAFGWAALAVFWCTHAFAIGLGDITVHSALNQNLNADIQLLQTRGLSESEVIAQLGSSEDFKRVGVERFFFLTGLHFKVDMNAKGGPVLHVTSDTPITEPYLDFLVQVMWPNGRMLKEFTVLLDPPTYKEQPAPAVAAPSRSDRGGGPAGRVERTPTRPDSQVSLSSAPPSTQPSTPAQAPSDRLNGDSYGVTDRDDTLWAIAQRVRPAAGISVQQTMLAIVRLNPQAFIGGNINLLKAGYTLRLPDQADASSVAQSDAIEQVAAQNASWQAYRRGEGLTQVAESGTATGAPDQGAALAPQVDATAAAKPAATTSAQEGELRIVAADGADRGTGTGGGAADIAKLEGELAANQQEAERLTQQRDQAVQRLNDVTAKAAQAQRQIEVKDQQIAQLQAQLKSVQNAPAGESPQPAEAAPKNGLMDLLASPFVMIGAGVVLVLIVVAGLMRARSRRAAADDGFVHYDVPRRAATAAVGAELAADELPEEEDADLELAAEPATQTPAEELHAVPETAQTSDVIGEADIYIAYGRYPQAVNLLQGALDDDPNRHDVRLKLLEVYAETKAEAAFGEQMEELLARCDDNELLLEARELESKLHESGGGDVAATASTSEAPEPAEDFELDLDVDDQAHDDELPVARAMAPEAGPGGSDDLGGDLGIDFRGDDDEVTTVRGAAAQAQTEDDQDADVATADNGEEEFNLEDLEYEPPTQADTAAKPEPQKSDSDDAFDFLDEEDAASTKLDLARAYIDMGDSDGAREILSEVLQEGSNEQQQTANELLAKLG